MSTRTRLLLIAAAVVAVAAMVLIARCGGTAPDSAAPPAGTVSSAPVPETSSTGVDDDHGGDGAEDDTLPPVPAGASEAAIQVAVKILNTTGKTPEQWRGDLRPLVDDNLYAELADADPTSVPVGRVDDAHVTAAVAGDGLVQVTVPVVDRSNPPKPVATIRVTVKATAGRWLATELDVENA